MFTAMIIDFPVYLRNILWEDKMTGHTLAYERSLGIKEAQAESATVTFKGCFKTLRIL